MQVKVCPKCGTENKPTNASCANCYSSLADVHLTLSKKPDEPVIARPPVTPTETPKPPTPQPGGFTPQSGPSPYPGYSPYAREKAAPEPKNSSAGKIIAVILILLLLGGGGYGAWRYFNRQSGPEAVIQTFMDATKAGDMAKAKSCLSQNSISLITAFGGEEALAQSLKKSNGQSSGKIIKTTYDNNNAVVEVEPDDTSKLPPGMKSTEIVLIQENKAWKIDLMLTSARMMQKFFGGASKGGFGTPQGGNGSPNSGFGTPRKGG